MAALVVQDWRASTKGPAALPLGVLLRIKKVHSLQLVLLPSVV